MKATDIPEAWKKALLLPLAKLLFEAAGSDIGNAWRQAVDLVRGYQPGTELEYRLIIRMAILNIQSSLATEIASQPSARIGQVIRLQANALALARAADEAEDRLHELQSIRLQRTQAPQTARQAAADCIMEETILEPTPAAKPSAQSSTAKTHPVEKEAVIVRELARKHNVSYAEAWGLYQREKKAGKAQPTT
jgi:hypothetical protein